MKQVWTCLLLIVIVSTACAPRATGIEVSDAWARPALQGNNGAVYFVIRNGLEDSDELTGASSEIAGSVEIHETKSNDSVMQMEHLHSIPLEAGAEVTFSPGGYHLMLVGLKQELRLGDQFEITLHFQNHADVTVPVNVSETSLHE